MLLVEKAVTGAWSAVNTFKVYGLFAFTCTKQKARAKFHVDGGESEQTFFCNCSEGLCVELKPTW